ncbi:hypothetical protein QQ020_25735 [Fulvivirgaceae bacterium BMA12]|uniref:Uncharacterized protein n=1 Tax=Agaribacillus aureus TaxID=3051825 RepID=A0ABT8LCJ8_9BACT|nr:hypothetical protein [Fulvivirgaceae bacterium BMA12]
MERILILPDSYAAFKYSDNFTIFSKPSSKGFDICPSRPTPHLKLKSMFNYVYDQKVIDEEIFRKFYASYK